MFVDRKDGNFLKLLWRLGPTQCLFQHILACAWNCTRNTKKEKKARESPHVEANLTASSYKRCLSWILLFLSLLKLPPIYPPIYISHGCQHRFVSSQVCLSAAMAITHDDLSIRRKFQNTDISSRFALFLVIFSVLCGLATFILCLTAEGNRSEVLPLSKSNHSFTSVRNWEVFFDREIWFVLPGDMVAYEHPSRQGIYLLLQW